MDVFSSLTTVKPEADNIEQVSQNVPTHKTTKSFLLPDFFSTSSNVTPAMSPMVEKSSEILKENFNKNNEYTVKPGFKFSPSNIEVKS